MRDEEHLERFIQNQDIASWPDETSFVMGKGTVFDKAFGVAYRAGTAIGSEYTITHREERGLSVIWHLKRKKAPDRSSEQKGRPTQFKEPLTPSKTSSGSGASTQRSESTPRSSGGTSS